MTEFNLNDYIWYIVIGVMLFFILVGFIADKTGLAKKTFAKIDSTPNKKKDNKKSDNNQQEEVQPIEEEYLERVLTDSDSSNVETALYTESDIVPVSDMETEVVDFDSSLMNTDDIQSFTDLEDLNEPVTTDFLSSDISLDDVEEAYINEPIESDNSSDDVILPELDDIALPELDDLSEDSNEDVWKF